MVNYENKFTESVPKTKYSVIKKLNFTCRLNFDEIFEEYMTTIYLESLVLNKENGVDDKANVLDLFTSSSGTTLRDLLTKTKTTPPPHLTPNVIYEISCNDCTATDNVMDKRTDSQTKGSNNMNPT